LLRDASQVQHVIPLLIRRGFLQGYTVEVVGAVGHTLPVTDNRQMRSCRRVAIGQHHPAAKRDGVCRFGRAVRPDRRRAGANGGHYETHQCDESADALLRPQIRLCSLT
jgi:hypothetical protein